MFLFTQISGKKILGVKPGQGQGDGPGVRKMETKDAGGAIVCVCVLHGVDSYSLHFSRSYITSIHRMPAPSLLGLLPVSTPFLHPALSSSSSPLNSPLSLLPHPAPTAPNISRPTRRTEVQIAIALRLRGKYGAILAHLITGGALLSHISAVDLLR